MPVSDLCDELQINPNVFYLWQKTFFEQGAAAFERLVKKGKSATDAKDRQIAALQLRLATKNEVIAELLEENVRSKKAWKAVNGSWVPHDTRDEVVDYVNRWSKRALGHLSAACSPG